MLQVTQTHENYFHVMLQVEDCYYDNRLLAWGENSVVSAHSSRPRIQGDPYNTFSLNRWRSKMLTL